MPAVHPSFKINGIPFPDMANLHDFAVKLSQAKEDYQVAVGVFLLEWLSENDTIVVNTSGSTGVPKRLALRKLYVANSARATIAFFKVGAGARALLCMSANYIAGKMMLVRAMIAGWDLIITEPKKDPLQGITGIFDFVAMVPYQVHHSFDHLDRVKKLIIGGGIVSPELENRLNNLTSEVFVTYGMTETISHIALRPINGLDKSKVYKALPGVSFVQQENGCLTIVAPSISEKAVHTNDVVQLLSNTSFVFLGRIDNVINSGGIKIHPEQLEGIFSKCFHLNSFFASRPDEQLGERLILVVEGEPTEVNIQLVKKCLFSFPSYHKPKDIIWVSKFCYTETGKIQRAATLEAL